MSTDLRTELHDFYEFVGERVRAGMAVSPEEALDAWRRQHPDDSLRAEDVKAVKAALRDMKAGDAGVPFEEFDREFREKHSIPLSE